MPVRFKSPFIVYLIVDMTVWSTVSYAEAFNRMEDAPVEC